MVDDGALKNKIKADEYLLIYVILNPGLDTETSFVNISTSLMTLRRKDKNITNSSIPSQFIGGARQRH